MKAIILAFGVLFMPAIVTAQQSIAPSVNNLAGYDLRVSDLFITTSIGEPAITTINSGNNIITQGFLQPEILPCIDIEFRYYPNPVTDWITIESHGCEVQISNVRIYDMWGRLLTTAKLGRNNELNIAELSQGVYLIKVKLTNEDVHTISIVKT